MLVPLQFSRNPKVAEHSDSRRTPASPACASIQPQPKGRGTRDAPGEVPGAGVSFNSAATQRSRNTGHRPLYPPAPPRFNSAATQRSRNTTGGRAAQRRRVEASIQPQPKGRGTPERRLAERQPVDPASIQPQPKGRGTPSVGLPAFRRGRCFNSAATQRSRNTPVLVFPRFVEDGASIQPQPKGRGTLGRGVNGNGGLAALQFSRNPKVAEHGRRPPPMARS